MLVEHARLGPLYAILSRGLRWNTATGKPAVECKDAVPNSEEPMPVPKKVSAPRDQ